MTTRAPTTTPSVCLQPKAGDLPRPNGSANSEMRTRNKPPPITTLASIGLSMVGFFIIQSPDLLAGELGEDSHRTRRASLSGSVAARLSHLNVTMIPTMMDAAITSEEVMRPSPSPPSGWDLVRLSRSVAWRGRGRTYAD